MKSQEQYQDTKRIKIERASMVRTLRVAVEGIKKHRGDAL